MGRAIAPQYVVLRSRSFTVAFARESATVDTWTRIGNEKVALLTRSAELPRAGSQPQASGERSRALIFFADFADIHIH